VSNSDGTVTISPTTGAVVASLALSHANTWGATQTFGTNISIGGVTPTGATGSNLLVFATSPVLTTPNLGTPSAVTLTNGTGLLTTRTISQQFGTPGGSAISTGVLGYVRWPYACTGLASWSITVDAGTATVKTWKIASGTAIPTVSNSISTSGVSISSGTNVTSATVTDFTTVATTAGDIFGISLITVSGVGWINFELVYTGCTQ